MWERVETSGDIPAPRSGHAVTAYGKYMLLFGGIDFAEEAVYNDLYTFDTGEHFFFVPSLTFLSNRRIYIK